MRFLNIKQKGFGVVEVVIGATILSIVFLVLFGFFVNAMKMARHTTEITQVGFLLDEGIEVTKFLRDESWTTNIAAKATGTPYALNFSAMKWEITTGSDTIDSKFHRTVTFDDVYRDFNDDISTSGTLATGTKKVTVDIEWWRGDGTSSQSISTYITDIFAN